jgi:hypothetical protein
VMRLPAKHVELPPLKSAELPMLSGSLKGKVRARQLTCRVYKVERNVVDQYSARMHQRQRPGLERDRKRARQDLQRIQELLGKQALGLRRAKPLTVASVKRRVGQALAREHMTTLFEVHVEKGERAPVLLFEESEAALQHLHDFVLGRTLLVTDRPDWPAEQIVHASRVQSHNESFFREIKDPNGVSMLPLRHRRDAALRTHALVVVLGLLLAKVAQRRLKAKGVEAPTIASVLEQLQAIRRVKLCYGPGAPPALRALAEDRWIPSARSELQRSMLSALGLAERPELGATLAIAAKRSSTRRKSAQR